MTSLPISIPEGYILSVNKGDTVQVGDVLAKKTISDDSQPKELNEILLNISGELEVHPTKVKSLLKKGPGDILKPGDIIAEKSQILGLKSKKIISEIHGTITKFDRVTGLLTVQTQDIISKVTPVQEYEEVIYSPLDGTVTVCNNDSLEIEGKGTGILGTKGVGGIAKGEIYFLEGKEEKVISTDITSSTTGKILLVNGITREAIAKGCAVDVKGIISTKLADEDLTYINEKRLPISVIEVNEEIFKKLKKEKDSVITIHGEMKLITPTK